MFIEPNTPQSNLCFSAARLRSAPCALRSRAAEKQIADSMLTFYKHVTPTGFKSCVSSLAARSTEFYVPAGKSQMRTVTNWLPDFGFLLC